MHRTLFISSFSLIKITVPFAYFDTDKIVAQLLIARYTISESLFHRISF